MNKVYKFIRAESINDTSIKSAIFIIAFFSVFLCTGLCGIFDFAFLHYYDWSNKYMVIVPIAFCLLGGAAIIFGIVRIKRQRGANTFETSVIKKGEAVVAFILRYKCIEEIRHSNNGRSHSVFRVNFNYRYMDLNGETVTKNYKNIFGYRPQLYKGSKIMVAIDGENSVILKNFVLNKDSLAALDDFISTEVEADFDGLDGREMDVDRNSVKYSTEFSHVLFWAGVALMIFSFVAFTPFYFVLSKFIDILTPKLIFIGVLAAINIALYIGAFYLVFKGRKAREKEKRILNKCKFAAAHYNVPSTVYSDKKHQYCTFCFIDFDGNKHRYNITSRTAELLLNENAYSVAAYTKDEAILIIDYKIRG